MKFLTTSAQAGLANIQGNQSALYHLMPKPLQNKSSQELYCLFGIFNNNLFISSYTEQRQDTDTRNTGNQTETRKYNAVTAIYIISSDQRRYTSSGLAWPVDLICESNRVVGINVLSHSVWCVSVLNVCIRANIKTLNTESSRCTLGKHEAKHSAMW